MNKIDLNKYQDFVEAVTSAESNDSGDMAVAVDQLGRIWCKRKFAVYWCCWY